MNRQEFIEYVVRTRMDAYPWASVEDMAKDAAAAWEIMRGDNPNGAHVSYADGVPRSAEEALVGFDVGKIANIATEVELSLKPISPAAGYLLDVTLRYRNGKHVTISTSMQILEEDRKVTLAVPHV